MRIFPISNWTELDVWQYIAEEQLEVPSIYFAHEREVFARDGMLYAVSPFMQLLDGERPFTARVRYRTVGDMTCTGAVESDAATLAQVRLRVGDQSLTAVITADAVRALKLRRGDDAIAIIKSTEVMVATATAPSPAPS